MFIKKTNCDKFLVSLTAQEFSGLRAISSWHITIASVVTEKAASTPSNPSHGNPCYIKSILANFWDKSNPYREDITNAG